MLSIAIQAGGESRRMGRNKALMPFAGKPLIAYLAARLAPAAGELFVIANQPEAYRFLGLPIHPDATPGRGPLGGLEAAMRLAMYERLAVVACDMPFASPALLRYQAELLETGNADLVVPETAEGLEPLHAVYRTTACLPVVAAALAAGDLKLSGWFDQVRVWRLAPYEWAAFDPDAMLFTNLNEPEGFRAAERYAQTHPR